MESTQTDTACVVLESVSDARVVVAIPRTSYRLDLVNAAPAGSTPRLSAEVGRHIHGVVHARALKMHRATAGGVFIEPVDGHPRSVQGRVLATDTARNQILAHVVIPMWIAVPAGQAAADFSTGELLNFYVESGTAFTIAS
ncbi:MAG: hypothetical protein EXS01_00960 [Phycisphaerales bacterium]|nr:hypothetical protein [Phycisphaerales bacterium]